MKRIRVLVAAVLLLPLLPTSAASIASAQGSDAVSAAAGADGQNVNSSAPVTLITGDQVELVTMANGRQSARLISSRPGVAYRIQELPTGIVVVPSDAESLLASGRLDEQLFDVSALVRFGYDDGRRNDVPLLVAGQVPGELHTQTSSAPSGLGLTAVSAQKADTVRFWTSVRGAGPTTSVFTSGVDRVWLDGKAYLSDDRSAAQIGAPAAWRAGYTGKGVAVAVLDSGYDQQHPDLQGVVAGAKDFVGSPNGVADMAGHGTHVSSILAGTGAASGGKYKGIAPDARLVEGKVCGDTPQDGCPYSAILAGMRWAAVDQHAKVVNMSLGSYGASDGSDPLSQAAQTLSAQTGALFVVAAGNNGYRGGQSISSPAAAEASLAVASVNSADEHSFFSSMGPRLGDYSLKPDIAAPGENILAARAKGTGRPNPADASYTPMSGTSMAAPHVAGAAADLAQQHPDWTGQQLKSALMSTAAATEATVVYEQGAGRVDLARAVSQSVVANQGSLSFGLLKWPHTDQKPVVKTVTYRNDGDAPVTLTFAVAATNDNGAPAPANAFTLDQPTATVAARSTLDVKVTLDPRAGTGLFGGWVTATSADKATVVRTAVGAYNEEEKHDLTVTILGRDGRPAADCLGGLTAVRRTDGRPRRLGPPRSGYLCTDANGVVTLRGVPRSDLAVVAVATTLSPDRYGTSQAFVAIPSVSLDKDTSLTADTRTAKPLTVQVDEEHTARQQFGTVGWFVADQWTMFYGGQPTYGTTLGAPAADFTFFDTSTWTQPTMRLRIQHGVEVPVTRSSGGDLLLGEHEFPLVDCGSGTAADLTKCDPKGKLAFVRLDGYSAGEVVNALSAAGAAGVLLKYELPPDVPRTALPVLLVHTLDVAPLLDALAAGGVRVQTTGIRNSPYRYELAFTEQGAIPDGAAYTARRDQLATVRTGYHSVGDQIGMTHSVPIINGVPLMWSTTRIVAPADQIGYFTPGTSWLHSTVFGDFATRPFGGEQRGMPTVYEAGQEYREDWQSAVLGPRVSLPNYDDRTGKPLPVASRTGDMINVDLPLLSDGNPGHQGFAELRRGPSLPDIGSTTLSSRSTVLGTNTTPGFGSFTAPAGPGRYQLTAQVKRPYWHLSTDVRTTWTFASDTVPGTQRRPLPLLDLRPVLPVDDHNAVPAGKPLEARIIVGHQPGAPAAPVTSVTAEVSFDDGAHWLAASTEQEDKDWSVRLPGGGAAGGFASLRLTAQDSAGNAIDQTTLRAWSLR